MSSQTSLTPKVSSFELSPTFINANTLQIQTRSFASLPGQSDNSFKKWIKPTLIVFGTGFIFWNWGWTLFKFSCIVGGVVIGVNWLKVSVEEKKKGGWCEHDASVKQQNCRTCGWREEQSTSTKISNPPWININQLSKRNWVLTHSNSRLWELANTTWGFKKPKSELHHSFWSTYQLRVNSSLHPINFHPGVRKLCISLFSRFVYEILIPVNLDA